MNKLWEEVAAACVMTSGKYFQMTGMLYSEIQLLKYTYAVMP